MNLVDPTGKFAFLVVVAIAVIVSSSIGAKLTYDAAYSNGLRGEKLMWSTILGGVTTGAATGLSIAFPPLAPLWGGLAAGIENAGNQWIERGDFNKINWGRTLISGAVGAATAYGIGKLFAAIPGVDRVFTEYGQAAISSPIGAIAGYCIDFGFGTDAKFDIFCGVTLSPMPKQPQVSGHPGT